MKTTSSTGKEKRTTGPEVLLHGIGVSPGVVVGPVYIIGAEEDHLVERGINPDEVAAEIGRLEDAIIDTRGQIKDIQKNISAGTGYRDPTILDAHLMVLDDRAFIEEIIRLIARQKRNAEAVLWTVANRYMATLASVEDDYLRERVADIKDVARRIVRNLSGGAPATFSDMKDGSIVVANDLAPSDTAALPRDKVLGFATDLGSPTAHTAVMARSMEIPAVVGMHNISERIRPGQIILIDGNKGVLIIDPAPSTLDIYGKVIEERRHIESELTVLKDQPAETKDGIRIVLAANIEMPSDVSAVLAHGAEGIGLFRSEYAYMAGVELPSENELAEGYKTVASSLAPSPVTIRTLDVGGDKLASFMGMAAEVNPFLGMRSIRFCLAEPAVFKPQLRAILRASAHGNVRIMYPMISNTQEVHQANAMLNEAMAELRNEGVAFDENILVGVMIETPSAALTADLIAEHVDFFSIGSNDLIQYTIAIDRVNEQLAYLYEPTHPAILKLIKTTVDAGNRAGISTGVCGEMAGDPVICPLLIGLGVTQLSVAPAAVPIVKDAIRSLKASQAEELASKAMASASANDVLQLCRDLIAGVAPEILELTG